MPTISRSDSAQWGVRAALAALILLPLFFQLQGTIYHSPKVPLYDSGGNLFQVPLPVSILVCMAGPLLIRRFARARVAVIFVSALAATMLAGWIIATFEGGIYGATKVLLAIQYLVPASALVLGMMFEDEPDGDLLLPRAFAYLLAVFVFLNLYLTHTRGTGVATWHMELFSIYQHRQYVPVILVAAFVFALFSMWESTADRPLLIYLGLVVGAYVGLSFSILALGFLVFGVLAFAVLSRQLVLAVALVALSGGGIAAMLWRLKDIEEFRVKFLAFWQGNLQLPEYVSARIKDWTLYSRGILDGVKEMLFGHPQPFDRSITTSAHNYYLDLVYNFGLIAFLPLLILIAYTARLLVRERRRVRSELGVCGLALVVLFLVLVDSNFKVTLRQPYPGIFAFFLWGVLLARLRAGTRLP